MDKTNKEREERKEREDMLDEDMRAHAAGRTTEGTEEEREAEQTSIPEDELGQMAQEQDDEGDDEYQQMVAQQE
ncbi:hypothetical protein CYMTET_12521 [Cymbomonas tetramitiformis]|uniref:Uncharacterized protein n=1 Tax=Cymbomonas tetramitiformis TaxID=36881 RepID=A0AAE0ESJ5_9CHLO|nr:hypothetical protein CYMTET_50696 [Cymbomonas tetramitiformis]KAK3254891.1 hypothetical protein CYMTET_35910 [Cymbomonas tetramitiformis]KAK3279603.1 hypothetical protein CYMTET_12521 [Cymbomonas tetramitiformis]